MCMMLGSSPLEWKSCAFFVAKYQMPQKLDMHAIEFCHIFTFVAQTESFAKVEDVCEKGSGEMMAVFLRG